MLGISVKEDNEWMSGFSYDIIDQIIPWTRTRTLQKKICGASGLCLEGSMTFIQEVLLKYKNEVADIKGAIAVSRWKRRLYKMPSIKAVRSDGRMWLKSSVGV